MRKFWLVEWKICPTLSYFLWLIHIHRYQLVKYKLSPTLSILQQLIIVGKSNNIYFFDKKWLLCFTLFYFVLLCLTLLVGKGKVRNGPEETSSSSKCPRWAVVGLRRWAIIESQAIFIIFWWKMATLFYFVLLCHVLSYFISR